MDPIDSPPLTLSLYYFNPHTYGAQWFVMAATREEAIAAVRQWIRDDVAAMSFWDDEPDPKDDPRFTPRTAERKRAEWLDDEMSTLDLYVSETKRDWDNKPRCIEVHGRGRVIATEIS